MWTLCVCVCALYQKRAGALTATVKRLLAKTELEEEALTADCIPTQCLASVVPGMFTHTFRAQWSNYYRTHGRRRRVPSLPAPVSDVSITPEARGERQTSTGNSHQSQQGIPVKRRPQTATTGLESASSPGELARARSQDMGEILAKPLCRTLTPPHIAQGMGHRKAPRKYIVI